VLDPACGTGGFLAEAFEHLAAQVATTEDRAVLQTASLTGGEAKRLPYLLAQMNLLLHGLEAPAITLANTLAARRISEIGEGERVNIILTNPPFAGEEEAGIQANFPEDRRTTETALLFLQLIMRRLKRAGRGRAAVVVPNGTLFEGGVAARIKADLLARFNLHTVVRLPEGVFAPYTDIPTNILFFDTTGPTRAIRYWQQPMPAGRRKYSKTAPLAFEELADCLAWFTAGSDDARAWTVPAEGLIETDDEQRVLAVNLDLRNPVAAETEDHRPPEAIIGGILDREQRMLDLLREIEALVAERA
jgi:type I restriction enzyme M protein